METIEIKMVSHSKMVVDCEQSTRYELHEFFSFFQPGYQFMPAFKEKMWDGKIRLFNLITHQLHVGLYEKLRHFCADRGYKLRVIESEFGYPAKKNDLSTKEFASFVKELGLALTPRPYQLKSALYAIRHKRLLLLSPTASGKSLIIYLLIRWYMDNHDKDIIVIVPTTSLVEQMYKDFDDYGFDVDKYAHRVYSGADKNVTKRVTITTWQSVYKIPEKWFERFGAVFGDEAHGFKGKSLTTLMDKLKQADHRVGTTGTLDGTLVHKLVLEGLFGPVYRSISTKELQEKGYISDLTINMLAVSYPDQDRQYVGSGGVKGKPLTYQKEIDFLVTHPKRTELICELANSLEGNTIILFRFVEKHGKIIYDALANERKNVYYVHGGVDATDREAIRAIVEKKKDAIVVASEGVFSTGTNIRNLHNIVFASPSKGQIRVLQSIGRGLRLADNGQEATLIDIIDDLRYNSYNNHALRHANTRRQIYKKEQFKVKLQRIDL